MGLGNRAPDRFPLPVLIVEMGQVEQVCRCGGCRADEVGEHRAIVQLPGPLVQHLPAHALHVAHIFIANIQDKCTAGRQMGTNRC